MTLMIEILGWIGTGCIVLAYYLVSSKRVDSASRIYQLMNLFGAIGVGTNVYVKQSWPALALQIIWILIAVSTLFSSLKRRP